MDVIGLIPAGGQANRLGALPCSKEILPVGLGRENQEKRVVSEYLLSYYKKAGIRNVYFIIRDDKWDIPRYFRDGRDFGMNIGYLIVDLPYGVPFTLNQAYPFISGKIVAAGFLDIILEPEDSYVRLGNKLKSGSSDIVLGVYPVKAYKKWDMVDFDSDGGIKEICIKQERPDLQFGWTNLVWGPKFTEFLNGYLEEILPQMKEGKIAAN